MLSASVRNGLPNTSQTFLFSGWLTLFVDLATHAGYTVLGLPLK
jgi:hypothetical protein